MFYVYVLNSLKDKKSYISSTNNLTKRFDEHCKNKDKVASTKPKRPLKLIYYKAYKSEKDAPHREHNLKLKSRVYAQLRKRIINSLNQPRSVA